MPHLWRFCLLSLLPFAAQYLSAQSQAGQDYLTGSALYRQGYYDSACHYLQKSYQADSVSRPLLALYAEALSQRGEHVRAMHISQKLQAHSRGKQQQFWYVKALWLQGDVALRSGQLPLALEKYRQTLQQKVLPDTLKATLHLRLGLALFSMGKYEEAENQAQQAWEQMAPALPLTHPDWADYYKLKGAIYDRQAAYDSALFYYGRSHAVYRETYGEWHPETAKLWINQANVYHVLGANLRAMQLFRQGLEVMQEFLGEHHMLLAVIYNNMAIIDFDIGNFEKATIYYQHALNTYQQKMGKQSLQAAQIQNNIASAYLEMKDAGNALDYASRSLKIRKKLLDADNPLLAPVYVNLAGAYLLLQDFKKADYYSSLAISTYESQGEKLHPGMAESYTRMGESYLLQALPQQGLVFLRKAYEISVQLYGPHHTKLAYVNNQIGKAYMQLEKPDSALWYYERALQSVKPEVADTDGQTQLRKNAFVAQHFLLGSLSGKAEARFMQYRQSAGKDTLALKEADQIYYFLSGYIDEMRNTYQREESKLFLSGIARPVYANALEVAWTLYKLSGDEKYARQAFTFSEKSKYVLLSDFINDIAAKFDAGIPKEVLQEEQQIKSQITYLEKQVFQATHDSLRNRYEAQLASLKKTYLDFTEHLEEKYPAYYQMKYNPSTATIEELQQALQQEQQMVEYALTDSAVFIFRIDRRTINFYRHPIEEPLEKVVMNMRQGMMTRSFVAYTQNASKLYQLLAADWKRSQKETIVIPDGILGYVPFEVLLTREVDTKRQQYWHLPYLLKEHVISYHYSATLFLEKQDKQLFSRNMMVGFAPAFSSAGNMLAAADTLNRFTPGAALPGAEQELRKIAEIFRGQFFFGSDATESMFKQVVQDSRIIHLGTHGILDDDNPSMSHLLFSQEDASAEDNLLHTYEIYDLKLKAELVTLSACNTGAGQLKAGEGVMSMARGFAYAGCPNVVTSMWSASDHATAQLMQRFYFYLGNGWSKNKALHQAKLDFLAGADDNLSNPFYWGSFVLIGDTQPLHLKHYNWVVWCLAVSVCLLMGRLFYHRFFR